MLREALPPSLFLWLKLSSFAQKDSIAIFTSKYWKFHESQSWDASRKRDSRSPENPKIGYMQGIIRCLAGLCGAHVAQEPINHGVQRLRIRPELFGGVFDRNA